jgi:hypothetical protein
MLASKGHGFTANLAGQFSKSDDGGGKSNSANKRANKEFNLLCTSMVLRWIKYCCDRNQNRRKAYKGVHQRY